MIPGSGRSGEGNGKPRQYSHLENAMRKERLAGDSPIRLQRVEHDKADMKPLMKVIILC